MLSDNWIFMNSGRRFSDLMSIYVKDITNTVSARLSASMDVEEQMHTCTNLHIFYAIFYK
jgi:hypothetical protein